MREYGEREVCCRTEGAEDGFSDQLEGEGYSAYAYAEALNARGVVLGTSRKERTFVSGTVLVSACSELIRPNILLLVAWREKNELLDAHGPLS